MADSTLEFVAEKVGTDVAEGGPGSAVYVIAFGTGDPESGGHCWIFSRFSPPNDDDWGVCTVREIQQATIYEGIESFRLHRSGMECVFEPDAARETGYRELRISFSIDDDAWRGLAEAAKVVFRDCSYFTLAD
jgi:hypothetical protein